MPSEQIDSLDRMGGPDSSAEEVEAARLRLSIQTAGATVDSASTPCVWFASTEGGGMLGDPAFLLGLSRGLTDGLLRHSLMHEVGGSLLALIIDQWLQWFDWIGWDWT